MIAQNSRPAFPQTTTQQARVARFGPGVAVVLLVGCCIGLTLDALQAAPASVRSGVITPTEREFWSLQPITDPAPPALDGVSHGGIHNNIDRFVWARLASEGLHPAHPADRGSLLRRATFDLTGLPPTPREREAFLKDPAPEAFARAVERLLASSAYGERWGRHWLDVVRYADTAGETADYPTPLSYKYRNWVIDAFNADLPYDEFLREQIAGDILAAQLVEGRGASSDQGLDAARSQRYAEMMTATGFIAISRRFGFDIENYHHLTIQDTLDTLGQAVLGLSIGCARCHDHKYDPVSMEDYYAWYGIFESTRYSFPGSEEKKRPRDAFPVVPPNRAERCQAEFDRELAGLEARIQEVTGERRALQELADVIGELGSLPDKSDQGESIPIGIGRWRAYLEHRRLASPSKNRDGHAGFLVWSTEPLPIVGLNTSGDTLKAPGTVPPGRLVVHPQEKEGVGMAWRSPIRGRVRISGHVRDAHDCGDSIRWHLDRLGSKGLEPIAAGAIERNGQQSFADAAGGLAPEVVVEVGEFVQLAVMPKTHYGCDLTEVSWTLEEVGGPRRWELTGDVAGDFLEGNPHADRLGNPATWCFFQVAVDRGEAFGRLGPEALLAADAAAVRAELSREGEQLGQLTARRDALKGAGPYEVVYGAMEAEKATDAAVQLRGEKAHLGERVPRRNLEILGGQPVGEGDGSGRMQLADWLTGAENPLAARVMVNRIWQHHFGRGLVETENDFGTRGARPTHPALLDWLASRFVESGWSVKAMHRLIMGSATYQQSSELQAGALGVDPDARLLWRVNRRRLSAEEIRDGMLFVSGELDLSRGGEHPFPPVETWGFTQHAPYYGVYENQRRSVYLMQQRLKRHPFLSLFDGADVNASVARRKLTTVPTQALFLMNSEFVHDRSAAFARKLMAERVSGRDRLDLAFLTALGRPPDEAEVEEALAFVGDYRVAVRDGTPETKELAAWSAFARTLLTRNEFLFVD